LRIVAFLVFICTLILIAVVVLVVSAPVRAARARSVRPTPLEAARDPQREQVRRDELHAAREAKYREIRDAELDYRTGKLSREDYERVDGDLRSEALAILDSLEALDGEASGAGASADGAIPG
jgi:hypothetical protein